MEDRELRSVLERLRPYLRDGLLERQSGGEPSTKRLATAVDRHEDPVLHALLSTARVEDGPGADGPPAPAILLRIRDEADARARLEAAASRLAPGGLLLVWLEPGDDAPGRREEVTGILGAMPDLQVRGSSNSAPTDPLVIARRAPARPRVALLPDGPGACLQIRTLGPLEELEARGRIELCLLPADADAALLAEADLLIVQRFGGLPAVRQLLRARAMGIPTAVELDDDFFNLPWYNPGSKTFGRFENRVMLSALLRAADTVVTSTPYLGQRMRTFNTDVRTMHNLVDTRLFRKLDSPFHDEAVTTFGYIGTKTHEEDLRPVLPALAELIRNGEGRVGAVFIGHVPDELARLPGVRYLGWFGTYQNAAAALSRSGANVALAPLCDLEFNKSKSAMKYLEYGACGIPGIFSDVEAYRGFVRQGENGLLVREHTPEAWSEALRSIVADPDGRRRMGKAALQDVREQHSIERRAEAFFDLYRSVAHRPHDVDEVPASRSVAGVPPLSVVLNLFGDARDALPAVATIAGEFPEGTQIIVAADHSETYETLRWSGMVDVVPRPDNGHLNAIAGAVKLARAEWILCLDEGCGLPKDLLDRVRPLLAPDVGAVGPRIDAPISPQGAQRVLSAGVTADAEALRSIARDTPATPVTWLEPGCVLLQRQAVQRCGGVDPEMIWDDALFDLCHRLRSHGSRLLVANGALTGAGLRRRSSNATPLRRTRSRRRLVGRLGDKGAPPAVGPGLDPAPVFGLDGEALEVWIRAREEGGYLEACLDRVVRHADLPFAVHVACAQPTAELRRVAERYDAELHVVPLAGDQSLLDAALERPATHAALLHDGVMVTPGWLREMLAALHAAGATRVVPCSNDGSPEQRMLLDRGLSLATLDDLARARVGRRQEVGRPARRVAAFCSLVDLGRLRHGAGRGIPADGTWLASRAYVHVLGHPPGAAAWGMGPWPGGPFDVALPELPAPGGPPLDDRRFLECVRPLLASLRENPGNASVLAGLGRLYLERGEVQDAMSFLQRARRMDPFSPQVREALRDVAGPPRPSGAR